MKKNKFSIYFIFFSFLTLVTIFFSMVQKSYFNLIKPQESVANDSLLKDINPKLDMTVLDLIESKNSNTDENFDFTIIKTADQRAAGSTSASTSASTSITPTP